MNLFMVKCIQNSGHLYVFSYLCTEPGTGLSKCTLLCSVSETLMIFYIPKTLPTVRKLMDITMNISLHDSAFCFSKWFLTFSLGKAWLLSIFAPRKLFIFSHRLDIGASAHLSPSPFLLPGKLLVFKAFPGRITAFIEMVTEREWSAS